MSHLPLHFLQNGYGRSTGTYLFLVLQYTCITRTLIFDPQLLHFIHTDLSYFWIVLHSKQEHQVKWEQLWQAKPFNTTPMANNAKTIFFIQLLLCCYHASNSIKIHRSWQLALLLGFLPWHLGSGLLWTNVSRTWWACWILLAQFHLWSSSCHSQVNTQHSSSNG